MVGRERRRDDFGGLVAVLRLAPVSSMAASSETERPPRRPKSRRSPLRPSALPRPRVARRSTVIALLACTAAGGSAVPALAVIVATPTCNGKTATIYRGSGHAGTDGAPGSPMKVTGTDGADVIVGDSGKDQLLGGGGDDTICGGDGNDQVFDGAGADWVDGESGDDELFAGHGTDTLAGGDDRDTVSYVGRTRGLSITLQGTSDNGIADEDDTIAADVENAKGGSGDDHIGGSGVANLLMGGAGDDTISGYDGADSISDGPGTDAVEGGNDNDTLVAGLGRDDLSGGSGTDLASYAARTTGVLAVLAVDAPVSEDQFLDPESGAPDVENLRGGSGHDNLYGSPGENVINGAGGDDVLSGLDGDDVIYDGPGKDEVYGDDSNDAGVGDDLLVAGTGADDYRGGGGFDRVSYRARTQPVTAGIAAEAGVSGQENEGDTLQASVEGIHGGSGDDTLVGDPGNNTLWGGPGDGVDVLQGLGGDDTLFGEGGPDALEGNDGADHLFGMTGDDVFDLTADGASDVAYCGGGADKLTNGGDLLEPADVYDPTACEDVPQQ
jgi:Ca2+-binding RTX toxin-like protein